jgi:protoporphyrinogen oxidase
MSKEWIAERVSVVDLPRIERNIAEQRDDLSWGPNATFRFPVHGGTGAIYEGIADNFRERIHLNHEMCSIDLDKKQVLFTNGRLEQYDFLINTVPLDIFVNSSSLVPDEVKSAADYLVHNSGLIVGLGFMGKRDDTKCWMYFPEFDSPFYRVTNFHNYSSFNVPGGESKKHFSFMCETTYSSHKPVDKGNIVESTINGLISSGLIDEMESGNVVSRYLIDIPYSYPVPSIGRDRALAVIQPFLNNRSVYSVGRFGGWRYEEGNMDHSFMQGVQAVDSILGRSA